MSTPHTSPARRTQLSLLVASNVRAEMARQQKGLSDLAEILHIGSRAASARHKGDQPFSLNEIATLAPWLGVTVDYLFSEPAALAS
ncbi:helix-turn-helix domain-containing protein [Gulosibacter faecalis]|uniref:Helix-turn-helix domain-containing protein n=2 Tax=Gulosibacter faecalis TaxID=272240 RepID=A0ABW5UUD2_9MICO